MEKIGVYILKSQRNNRYYIGSTNDLQRRLKQHHSGLVKPTKNLKPLILAAFLHCDDLNEAKRSEYRLKQYKRKDILNKVVADKTFPWDYSSGL